MTKLKNSPLPIWLLAALIPVMVVFFWIDPVGIRHDVTMAALSMQRDLHRDLADVMRDTAADKDFAGWVLIGLSFVYGVFHAVGPGHGKVIIGTYLATHDQSIARGLLLANASALLQGIVAILAIGITVWVFGQTARDANATANQLEIASYGLVVLIGVFLCARAAKGLRRPASSCCSHHHANQSTGFLATLLSTGIRPCSGGILVLILASALGLWWQGMAAVMAMSIGTGMTVSVLAIIAVQARSSAQRLVRTMENGEVRMAKLSNLAALMGGVLIVGFGLSLIDGALGVVKHPLMRG